MLPVPLTRWANYEEFKSGGGLDSLIAGCQYGDRSAPGPFARSATHHLEAELVRIELRIAKSGQTAIVCHAGLIRSERVIHRIVAILEAKLAPPPSVSMIDGSHWVSWDGPPVLRGTEDHRTN